jgi:isopentenyldiphosphate isomerase
MERLYQLVYTIFNLAFRVRMNTDLPGRQTVDSLKGRYMPEEMLDVVNQKGETITSLPRSEIHGNPALLHRVVHVLVFNEKGELFLQKRSMSKDVAPGRWDTSVGGHVNAGETLDEAMKREMEEELGIAARTTEFLYSYIHSNEFESELVYTYSCVYNGAIHFQQDEIDEVRPWSLDEIRKSFGKGILSDNFEHEIKMYLEHAA